MIDHAAAQRLGATAMDFPLALDEEGALEAHLRACAACRASVAGLSRDALRLRNLDLGPVPVAVRAHVAIVAERRERSSRTGWVLLAAAALLVVAVLGSLATGVGAPGGDGTGGGDGAGVAPIGRSVHWTTEVVDLEVADFWLEASGRRWVPPPDADVRVSSDPGDATYWTLEITWFEGAVEQRMNLYFAADGTDWQITEARIYNGRSPAEWLGSRGSIATAPLGATWSGDLDIAVEDALGTGAGPGRIVMRDARLSVMPGGRPAAPVPVDPNQPVTVPIDPASGAAIDCGPVDERTCDAIVRQALADAATAFPGRAIKLVRVADAAGSHELHFADGQIVGTVKD